MRGEVSALREHVGRVEGALGVLQSAVLGKADNGDPAQSRCPSGGPGRQDHAGPKKVNKFLQLYF